MLSGDGYCKTFDASADGYVRGEGCGIIILKRLKDAKQDGDMILALIKGSAINQDGASSGLTVPNGNAQEVGDFKSLASSAINNRMTLIILKPMEQERVWAIPLKLERLEKY